MMNITELKASLPPMPDYRGSWSPIYLEPMIASGERLTVAIAAVSDYGDFEVHPAIRPHVIDAMFGPQSSAISKIISLICASAQNHIRDVKALSGWVPPMSGVSIGAARRAASYDLTGILRQAIMMTASLSALDLDPDSEDTDDESWDRQQDAQDRWPTLFRKAALASDPRIETFFNRSFQLSRVARPTKIFYLSDKVAINTGKLVPGASLPRTLEQNKAKMFDLLGVRDKDERLFARSHYELVVFRPSSDDPLYSEKQLATLRQAMESLSVTGKEHQLRVSPVSSPEEAAKKLLTAEAA